MRKEDIPEYAEAVIGFPITAGMKVLLEDECIGTSEQGHTYTTDKGAEATVVSVRLLPWPQGLTIALKIRVYPEQDFFVESIFSEADPDPEFPFVVPKTQEEIELERAEAAAKAEAAKPASEPVATGAVGAARPQQQQQRGPWDDGDLGDFHRGFFCH